MSCNGQKKCGCIDKGLSTLCPVCNPVDCPDTTHPCAEVFCAQCIVWCGPGLPALFIEEGDTVYEILQTIATETDCKRMIMNFRATTITSTAIHLAWENEEILNQTDPKLEVQYATDPAGPWSANPEQDPPTETDIIGNALTSDTDYFIKIVVSYGGGDIPDTCESAMIKVKTKPSS